MSSNGRTPETRKDLLRYKTVVDGLSRKTTTDLALERDLNVCLGYLRKLAASGGPTKSEYSPLIAVVHWIHQMVTANRLPFATFELVRKALGDAVSTKALQGWAFHKPHGYAGDYEIIDRTYLRVVSSEESIRRWDLFYHATPAIRAVRNRKLYFKALLDAHYERNSSLRVLKIGSGPGRGMYEWLRAHRGPPVSFECVEVDPCAIAYAKHLNSGFLDRIVFYEKNVLRFRPPGDYDFIWAAGIFDYFNDRIFVRLLTRLAAALTAGGELVIGNFCATNPTRAYMEVVGNWILFHRSAENLRQLAERCGISEERVTITCEAEGVNLFLHVKAKGPDSPQQSIGTVRTVSTISEKQ